MTSDEGMNRNLVKDLMLAEFANLRQEQFNRTNSQQTLININLTAAVAVAGVVLSRIADQNLSAAQSDQSLLLILLLPALSFALGLQYYGQDMSIMLVGRYIDEHLRPMADKLVGPDDKVFQWEPHVRKHERGVLIRFVMTVDMLMLFPGVSAAALGFAFPVAFSSSSPHPLVGIVWLIEAGLTLILAALWIPAANADRG